MSLFSKKILPILVLACLPALLFSQANSNDWVFKNEKDGVKVFYRKTSDIHEVKLCTSIKTSLSGIVHLLSEVEKYPTWGYKVMESNLLRKISDSEIIYHSRLDFPWPLSDRDFIMSSKLYQDPNSRVVISSSESLPDYIPEKKDVVRVRTSKTTWKIWPGSEGWAYIEYYIYSDPGGKMPDWLVNMAIDMGPRETIKRMRQILKRPEYQAVRLAHIMD